jgi:hypothetical protein
MDESSHQAKKPKGFDFFITAINMAAMGAGIAAAITAANKSKSASTDAERIEKSMSELNAKFDKISEQLKGIQPAKIEVPGATAKDPEKRLDNASQKQQKPQEVIYVRKSSEFSFYN